MPGPPMPAGAPRDFAPVAGVYALADPDTDRIMYIGQSIDIEFRYRRHVDPLHRDSNIRKGRWIADLRTTGKRPVLRILARCQPPESDEIERDLIRQYRAIGQAELNIAEGGLSNRGSSRLSRSHRDDWVQLGRKAKLAHDLLMEIKQDTSQLVGIVAARLVNAPIHALDRVKVALDAAVCRAFPEWRDFGRTFYGQNDPEA